MQLHRHRNDALSDGLSEVEVDIVDEGFIMPNFSL